MAKRRKRAPKGKARAQRAKPEAMRLPGGRKLETVRRGRRRRPAGHPRPHRRHPGADAQGRHHHARHAPGGARLPGPLHHRRLRHHPAAVHDPRLGKSFGKGRCPTTRLAARERVYRALEALGGMSSPGGSCVWSVAGLGHSLREWALGQGWNGRPVHMHQTTGVLITALGMLAVHYGYERANSRARTTG